MKTITEIVERKGSYGMMMQHRVTITVEIELLLGRGYGTQQWRRLKPEQRRFQEVCDQLQLGDIIRRSQ